MSYLSSFIRFTWLSVGVCPVFVAVTEREIRVRTHRQTVLINANFWPRVQHPRPYCTTITSGSVPGFIPSQLDHAVLTESVWLFPGFPFSTLGHSDNHSHTLVSWGQLKSLWKCAHVWEWCPTCWHRLGPVLTLEWRRKTLKSSTLLLSISRLNQLTCLYLSF